MPVTHIGMADPCRPGHMLLHRSYIIGGRQEATNLIESPFLLHPIENHTAGLYRAPVATLDFASLYPSLYRAYNLCYTTLVHPDDVGVVGRQQLTFTPTGHAFVQTQVRRGRLEAGWCRCLCGRSRVASPRFFPALGGSCRLCVGRCFPCPSSLCHIVLHCGTGRWHM
jgi:hypothetical protein